MTKEIYAGMTKAANPIENGVYPARLFQIIQIGSQYFCKRNVKGDVISEWYSPQILLGFELPTIVEENMDGVKFAKIKSVTYFLSMNPSRNGVPGLREIIDGMRGSAEYSEEELQKFSVTAFMGKIFSIKLDGVESKGQVFQNITGISPLGKDEMPKLDPDYIPRKEILVTIDDFKNLDTLGLPDWIQDKIMKSSEYADMEAKANEPEFVLPPHPTEKNSGGTDDDGIDIDDLEL